LPREEKAPIEFFIALFLLRHRNATPDAGDDFGCEDTIRLAADFEVLTAADSRDLGKRLAIEDRAQGRPSKGSGMTPPAVVPTPTTNTRISRARAASSALATVRSTPDRRRSPQTPSVLVPAKEPFIHVDELQPHETPCSILVFHVGSSSSGNGDSFPR